MKKIKVPYLTYDDIRRYSDDFISKYNPSRTIPTPIEEIVEIKFGIDIIPLPGLHQSYNVDGFIYSDLKAIAVDESVYFNRPARYRFTLAHEIGHRILHKDFYEQYKFKLISEWKDFIKSISDKDYSYLEYHAYCFAGLILVPPKQLLSITKKAISHIEKEGISLKKSWDFAWDYISEHLAKEFVASKEVIIRRLEFDKTKEQYK